MNLSWMALVKYSEDERCDERSSFHSKYRHQSAGDVYHRQYIVASNPLPALDAFQRITGCFRGCLRLPYGDRPDLAYNLSLFNLDAMFAPHVIANGGNRRRVRVSADW
jgi:hypothetical protein